MPCSVYPKPTLFGRRARGPGRTLMDEMDASPVFTMASTTLASDCAVTFLHQAQQEVSKNVRRCQPACSLPGYGCRHGGCMQGTPADAPYECSSFHKAASSALNRCRHATLSIKASTNACQGSHAIITPALLCSAAGARAAPLLLKRGSGARRAPNVHKQRLLHLLPILHVHLCHAARLHTAMPVTATNADDHHAQARSWCVHAGMPPS